MDSIFFLFDAIVVEQGGKPTRKVSKTIGSYNLPPERKVTPKKKKGPGRLLGRGVFLGGKKMFR